MDNSNSPTPTPPTTRAPQDFELYRHISQEDAEMPVVKQEHKSPVISAMASIMRVALYFDSVKHTHELTFRRLNALWGILMFVLYTSGILMLGFSVYNRLKFPLYLEQQLKAKGIQFGSAQYDMNRIEMRNLKGPDGLYTVDTLIAHTTLIDLLQKRIRSIMLDGVNIYLDSTPDFNLIQDLPKVLTQLQHPAQEETDLTIGALTINNAKFKFQQNQLELPLSFSMQGVYDNNTKITIPLSVNQPHLSFQGTLSISGSTSQPTWILKISSGTVTLPRSAPENFTGEIQLDLNEKSFSTLQATLQLGTGTIHKEISVNLKPKEDSALAGTLRWTRKNVTEPQLSSDLSFTFDSLTFSAQNPLQTKGPLTVEATKFNLGDIFFQNLHQILNANIVCQTWRRCNLNLQSDADIVLPNFQFKYLQETFRAEDALHMTLKSKQSLITMDANGPDFYIGFNIPMQNVSFSSDENVSTADLDIEAQQVSWIGSWADESRLELKTAGLGYTSNTLEFDNATLNIADLLQETSQITLQAQNMHLFDMPVLSQPFDINFKMIGTQAAAQLKFQQQPFTANIEGQISLVKKTFSGQLNVPPFDLKDVRGTLNTLWPNIPANVYNPTGKVAIRGALNWNAGHATGNPLYIGLKDVSFDFGQTKISGINTVVTAESLSPLTTKPAQHLFIRQIANWIPLQNLDAQFQLEGSSIKMNQLFTSLSSIPLTISPSVLAAKNGTITLNLKNNQTINLQQTQDTIQIPNLKVLSGTASMLLLAELNSDSLTIPNITMRLQDAQLQRLTPDYKDIFGNESGYFIRNGLITLDQNQKMQATFNGRLLPSKTAKEVQLNTQTLPKDLITPIPSESVPSDIQNRQKYLFGE